MKRNAWQKTLLRVVGTAAILTLILWFVPFSDIAGRLAAVRPGYLAAGIGLTLLAVVIESNQLWRVLRRAGLPVNLWTVFEAKMVSRFYGQFMAGELVGSAVKLYRLAGPTRQWPEVVAGMAFLRLINTLVLVLLGLVFLGIEQPQGSGRVVGVVLFTMAVLLIGLQIALASGAADRLAELKLLTRYGGTFAERLRKHGRTALDSYRRFGDMMVSMAMQAVLRHGLGMAGFACLALSLDIHLSLLTIGWLRVVLHAVMMLPITLSGVGLREGALVLLLQDYGVEASGAVALAFLVFVVTLLKNNLGGLLEARVILMPGRQAQAGDGPAQ